MSKTEFKPLTKADTKALWHAIDAFAFSVRAMRDIVPPLSDECIAQEKQRLVAARRALRKVNELRKQGL